jgi:hypothetical protein
MLFFDSDKPLTTVSMNSPFLTSIMVLVVLGMTITSNTIGQITKQWESRFVQTGFTADTPEDLYVDSDGNSYVLGQSGADGVVIKYDYTGKIVWSFQTGRGVFMDNPYEASHHFQVDAQGNVYLALVGYFPGASSPQVGVIKLDKNGKQLWLKYLPTEEGNIALAIHQDGSVFIFNQNDYNHVALTKFSGTGDLLWTKNSPSTETQYIQDVQIIDNKVITWRHTGLQTYLRTSYLQVFDTNGNLVWEDERKFTGYGTSITQLRYHSGNLYVAYYIDAGGPSSLTKLVRYDITSGAEVKIFSIQLDVWFHTDKPLACMYVGDDSNIYVLGEDELFVNKFSSDGILIGSFQYVPVFDHRYKVHDLVVHKETSTADILIETNVLTTGAVSYSVVSFKSDMTTQLLKNVISDKSNMTPSYLAEAGTSIYIAGKFRSGDIYKEDILVSKFSSATSADWEATYNPVNSMENVPTCMTGDDQGNVYVAGMLWFDDIYSGFGVIKYDPKGNQLWAKTIAPDNLEGHSPSGRLALAIAVNSSGEIFLTGAASGSKFSTVSELPVEMYLIKLDANGTTHWVGKTSGQTDDFVTGYQIVFDENQDVYVLGVNYNLNDHERDKMVLVKYDSNGALKWERRFGLFAQYNGRGTTGSNSEVPIIKVANNEIYIFTNGSVTEDNWNYKNAIELRKFDTEGNETLLKQISFSRDLYLQPRDLCLNANGNLYMLYSQHGYFNDESGYKTRLLALSPSGEKQWEIVSDHDTSDTYTTDGTLVINQSGDLFMITASKTEFIHSKVATDGTVLWNKKEILNGFDPDFGRPSFVVLKTDGNPVFLGTNKNDQNSKYYFICERDRETGEIIHNAIFDEIYDSFGWSGYFSPGDMVVSAFKPTNSDDLFIAGVIEDKARSSETIVALKYKFGEVSGGDGGDGGDGDGEITAVENDHLDIEAYPIPTTGSFRISGLSSDTNAVLMTDTCGRETVLLKGEGELFDISGSSPGIYYLKVHRHQSWRVIKIVKI